MRQRQNRSLASQLLLMLVLVQAVVPILNMAGWMLLSPYITWIDVAAGSGRQQVIGSLTAAPGGGLLLSPTERLRRYAASRAGFAYAVFRKGVAVPGSDPALVRLGPLLPIEGRLAVSLPGGTGEARVHTVTRPGGPITIITAGNAFHADDIRGYTMNYLPALVPIFGPSLLVAALVMPLLLHRGMRPLRRAAEQAGGIAFDALDERLSESGVPAEALPLVRAVNGALDRVAAGAERQRLFHANAAHELRTPVAIMQARLDSMPELPRGDALRADVTRIGILVEQLLAMHRLDAGQGDTQIDLVASTRALVADYAPLAIRSGRTLAFSADAPSMPVLGSRQALDSAVANMIDNAVRAEPEGGCVQVHVGPGAEVTVTDHGAGIEAADQAMMFEPFWRADEGAPGTGLGLSIVRQIARRHGGDVQIGQTEGGGATFRLWLPPGALLPRAVGVTAANPDRARSGGVAGAMAAESARRLAVSARTQA